MVLRNFVVLDNLFTFATKFLNMRNFGIKYERPAWMPEKTAWDGLPMSEKADIMRSCVRTGITSLQDIRTAYNNYAAGRNILEGIPDYSKKAAEFGNFLAGGGIKYGKPYYSYDGSGRRVDDTLNYNATLPEVTIIPDSRKSPAQRNEDERFRQRFNSDYAKQQTRDYTTRQTIAAQREWENSPQKRALDLGIAAAQGIGMASDVVSPFFGGIPVYSGLKGAQALDRAVSSGEAMDYVDAGLWLSPMLTVGGKRVYDAVKPAIQRVFQKGTPAAEWAGAAKSAFKSELDWTPESWFGTRATKAYDAEDVAALQSHVPEYLKIEQEAKANGTWLKMPNGSTWEGDPRSWVQLQSRAAQTHSPRVFYTGVDKSVVNPEYDGVLWGTYGQGKYSAGKARTYARDDEHVLTMFTNADVPTYRVNANGRGYGSLYPGTDISTDDVVQRVFDRGYKLTEFKNVMDTGSLPISNTSIYYTTGVRTPFSLQNDLVLAPNQIRKSLLGNNGNFSKFSKNMYKGIIPFALGTAATASLSSER